MNKNKLLAALLLFALAFVLHISDESTKSGTVSEVLNANLGNGYEKVTEIFDFIEVNDEGDGLCVFETDEKIAVAYLNCVGDGKYKFGTAVEYDHFREFEEEYHISCLKAGDSDLLIKYVVAKEKIYVKNSTERYVFSVADVTQVLHLISVEEEKCSGYVYYLETEQLK